MDKHVIDPGAHDDGSRAIEREHVDGASFAARLMVDRWLIGTVISSSDPVLAERTARPFDFVWIDLEHSTLGVRDAQVLAIALKAGGAAALVRLARADSDLLGAVLDAGVDGIVVPKIESADQAAGLVSAIRYPPRGTRGFAPRRSTGGTALPGAAGVDTHVACLVQIETRAALNNLEAIAATDGVDGLIVGTADLSFDLGEPLDMDAPALIAAVEAVGQAAAAARKPWGVAIGATPEWVSRIPSNGASLLVYSSDSRIFGEALDRSAQRARAIGHPVAR